MASVSFSQSRFASLKVDDEDNDEKQTQGQLTKAQQKNAQKKKSKKKKQQQLQAENLKLQQLAFGVPGKGGSSVAGSQHRHTNGGHGEPTDAQWDQWQKVDREFTQDEFERDLQQALLLSRLEVEETKQKHKGEKSVPDNQPLESDSKTESKDSKKKKKKAMSLDEFNKKGEGNKSHANELDPVEPVNSTTPTSKGPFPIDGDDKFFENVTQDVNRILRRDKVQEEYKIQYAAESVITAKYQDKINKLEKEVEFLKATMKKQDEELKQVKKRNKQLCVILAQGEMKEKSEVLLQVDQLNEVKDELTTQVSELTADLEKERSKVHTLKAELDKAKGTKHK